MSMHKGICGQTEGGSSVSFDRYPYMKHSTADETEKTLAQYIRRKQQDEAFNAVKEEKKLTFEEWWNTIGVLGYGKLFEKPQCEGIWNAAQENAPSYRPGTGEKI